MQKSSFDISNQTETTHCKLAINRLIRCAISPSRAWREGWSALILVLAVCSLSTLPSSAKSLKPVKDVETENEVIKLYNQALKYSKAERNVHARVVLEKAATYDPTSVSAYIHAALSEIYHDLGNPERAIKEAQTALRFDDSMKNLYYNLGLYCKDANRYEEGILYLTKFVESASGAQKVNALSLIDSLRNEQTKMGSFTNNDPDYLGQLIAEGNAHNWAASRVPIKVFIETTSSARGFMPGFAQIARNAFITWYQASGKKLAFVFVGSSGESDINVEWTDGTLKVGDEKYERTKAGLTTTTRRQSGIEHARIQIRTVRAFSKEPEPEDRIKETCLHEIGHALGLNGHSSNTADIMYFGNTARQLPALTRRDKATIAKLYQSYPPYPMEGVDTTFAYPAPSTDIPRLTPEQFSDTSSSGSQFNQGNNGGMYNNNNNNNNNNNTGNPEELLSMPDVGGETSLPGITYPAPFQGNPTYQNNYQQSPTSYQQPSFQQQRPIYQQPTYQQQPIPQQPAPAWQSAPAPYYQSDQYPATTPNTVPYSSTQPGTFTGQNQPYADISGQRQQYTPYSGQTSQNVGPEQVPANTAPNNPLMQFAQPIVQFAQQMFQQNQSTGQPPTQPGAQGFQPMVNQVMKMFQPQQQPTQTPQGQ